MCSPTRERWNWRAGINYGVFNYNGYYPDGAFMFGTVAGVDRLYTSFAHAQASGQVESHGVLLSRSTFQAGFVGPADARITYDPPDFTRAASSNANDRGAQLPGVNDGFTGAGPDLGALERGCPVPSYGPRAEGLESFTWLINCGNLFNALAEARRSGAVYVVVVRSVSNGMRAQAATP